MTLNLNLTLGMDKIVYCQDLGGKSMEKQPQNQAVHSDLIYASGRHGDEIIEYCISFLIVYTRL